jgi:hypothetical protein
MRTLRQKLRQIQKDGDTDCQTKKSETQRDAERIRSRNKQTDPKTHVD